MTASAKPGASHAVALARFLAGFDARHIGPAHLAKAKDHIADTLACGVGGACSVEARATLDMLTRCAEFGEAPVWGTPTRLTPRAAALVNGVATHAFELDDTMGCDHSGAVVLPAALSALTLAPGPVSGRDFVAAIILGYEVARRVMEALGGYWPHNEAGWHSTATCGTFGAAAAAARILGLDQSATGSALGHAASFSGGLWAFIHDASQTKRVHAGKAAEGGLTAALLARSGVSGPRMIFEDVWGSFLKAFAPGGHDATRLTHRLGEAWVFEEAAIKPYASCRGTHSTLDAVEKIMREHGVTAADIVGIEVVAPPGLVDMCGGEDLSNLASAQMSLKYAAAAFLERGDLGISAFSEAARTSHAIRDRMRIVSMRGDASLAPAAEPTVLVRDRLGGLFQACVDPALGAPGNPLPSERLRAKATELAMMALTSEQAARFLAYIDALERHDDVRALPAMLQAERTPAPFL